MSVKPQKEISSKFVKRRQKGAEIVAEASSTANTHIHTLNLMQIHTTHTHTTHTHTTQTNQIHTTYIQIK